MKKARITAVIYFLLAIAPTAKLRRFACGMSAAGANPQPSHPRASRRAARMARCDEQGEGISVVGVYSASGSRVGAQISSAAVPLALSWIYNRVMGTPGVMTCLT